MSDLTDTLARLSARSVRNLEIFRRGLVTDVDTSGSPWLATIEGREMPWIGGDLAVGDVVTYVDQHDAFAWGPAVASHQFWNWWELANQNGTPLLSRNWQPGFYDTAEWPNDNSWGGSFFSITPWTNAFVFHGVGVVTAPGVTINPFTQGPGALPVLHDLWTNEFGTSCALYGPTGAAGIPHFVTTFSDNPIIEALPDGNPRYAVDYRLPYTDVFFVSHLINYSDFIVRASSLRAWSVGSWASGGTTPSVVAQAGDRVVFMVATAASDSFGYSPHVVVSINEGSYRAGAGPFDGPYNMNPDTQEMFTPYGVSFIGADVASTGPVSINVPANGVVQRLGTFVFVP